MAELPEDDPLVQRAVTYLTAALTRFYGRPFDQATLDGLIDLMRHTRDTFKRVTGRDFPPLTPLLLPTSRVVHVYRADLDEREIGIKVLNLLRELGVRRAPVSIPELAAAISFAWPAYKPPIEDWMSDRQAGPALRSRMN